jgi:flagellar hook assembly protein FlgD
MGLVSLPYTITNPIIATAAMFNGDFDAIKAQVNGNLEEANVSELAQLTGATVTATEIKTKELDPTSTLVIKLPSADGSHSLRIKDSQGQVRVEIKSSGEVTFF